MMNNLCFRIAPIVTAVAAIMLSCQPDRITGDPSPSYPGMKKIASKGISFQQGWNDTLASLDEKPGMVSSFSYDYRIDSTEITQKCYFEITGRRPVPDSSHWGVGDGYPVYYVTWFDAVLFCNARSKMEKLDTVYAYAQKRETADGRVYDLTGLRHDLSRNGYRLPTEAEWEYAARGRAPGLPFDSPEDSLQAMDQAWFFSNSSATAHPVGLKTPNGFGLYDMAGNVFEWTNDWKGMYTGDGIANSIGSPDPNSDYEKVIKGGSYNYPMSYLRPSSRRATYATMISAANEYVGFRCARGAIDAGQYIGMANTGFTPNPVSLVAAAGDIRSFIGTTEAKIVFVNESGGHRTLCYVDFTMTYPMVREYLDDQRVYVPVLSPNGRFVAYCTANEGQSGPSTITIRSLDSLSSPRVTLSADTAYIPRWWIDRSAGDTCIVYANSAIANSNVLWKSTKTFTQKISGGIPVGEPQLLCPDGGFHDGRSLDGRYLVTAYDRLMVRDLVAQQEKQLFLSPENGKDAAGSVQVCNASMSPDTGSAARCLFLDFGSPDSSTITGSSYGIHEYLFVTSMSGAVTNFLHCPSGEKSWDFSEWSNRSRFAVSCGRNSAAQSHSIYAIDMAQKCFLPLVTGMEVQQPCLWIGFLAQNPSNLALDSIGRYNDPPQSTFQAQMASKLLLFWRIVDSLEIAITGSSQAVIGLDPHEIQGFSKFNLAAHGGDLAWQRSMILDYLLPHCSQLKMVCSSLDIGWLALPNGSFSWQEGCGRSKGYNYDVKHFFWQGSALPEVKAIFGLIPLPVPYELEGLGYIPCASAGWGSDPPPCIGSITWEVSDTNYRQNMNSIRMIADTMRARQLHWLVVNFPVSPYYGATMAYSVWGPSRTTATAVIAEVKEIERTNSFFHFYDANDDGHHDYGYEDAMDENHLSAIGAGKLGARVDSLIHTILN